MKKVLLYVGVPLFVAACSMAPEYERPVMPVEAVFPAAELSEKTELAAHQLGWRQYFKDERLQEYISLALDNNRDLRVALLNVEAARVAHRITDADRLPSLNAGGGFSRSKSPANPLGGNRISERYNVDIGVSSFELDFFGRVKSLNDAALNRYLASVEGQKATHIAIVAQVARSYMTEQLATEQLALARRTLSANQASYNLVKQQVDAGIANDLDLAQALGQVHSAKIEVAVYERQVAVAKNALHELVGRNVPDDAGSKRVPLRNHALLKALPAGLPSEVLLTRPDVMAAEYELKAENANIGAARAAFFPSISLTTTAGSISSSFSNLFEGDTATWSFSPSIAIPIFNWGKLKANVELSEIRKNIAIANYEKKIQTAFREVSDGLVSRAPLERQLRSQRNLVATTSEQLRLANLLYNNGIASYLDVLDAQRSQFSANQALLRTYYEQIMNSIALYSALGGGLIE